jgi:hypothetical protein
MEASHNKAPTGYGIMTAAPVSFIVPATEGCVVTAEEKKAVLIQAI